MAYYGILCGCWYPVKGQWGRAEKKYLPQVDLQSHTTILATTSRTTLKQTFTNSSKDKLDEVQYTFPLYDGVSVVGFKCTVASKTIVGVVKEKQQARKDYTEAVARGETAGLLEQLPEASDVFTTKVGNVPPKEKIYVEITYLGELKHDAETDGTRFTIPTIIAPRYGSTSNDTSGILGKSGANDSGGINILVDIALEQNLPIKGLQSPSHPIAVTMGRTSAMHEDHFDNNHASATLTLGSTELDKDFVIVVLAKNQDTPRALLETHPTLPNQRALMATLVPKFNIPNIVPEIVFVVDRSGSMEGKIPTLVSAMKIFLKSLPVSGIKFNICSFGSSFSFLFKKSKTYDQSSLQEALKHLETFAANFGGTEMLAPVKEVVKNRYKDMPLEVMLLTDGEIWNQTEMFSFITEQKNARFFPLGIGHGASSALVEGIARAGNGFAQFVADNEKMDKRIVRMLKGALTPHITDYSLEVQYSKKDPDAMSDEDFEIVESFAGSTQTLVTDLKKPEEKKSISLFNKSAKEEPTNPPAGRYDGLPKIEVPKVLQTPHAIPSLFPFNRTTVYLLLGPESCKETPKSVVLKGTSDHGPLVLEIPVEDVGTGETIHQLAAKKATQELEEGRGWITAVKIDGKPLQTKYEGRWDLMVEREAVRLGVDFQVGGKWCSFVAVEANNTDETFAEKRLRTVEDESVDYSDAAEAYDPTIGKSIRRRKDARIPSRDQCRRPISLVDGTPVQPSFSPADPSLPPAQPALYPDLDLLQREMGEAAAMPLSDDIDIIEDGLKEAEPVWEAPDSWVAKSLDPANDHHDQVSHSRERSCSADEDVFAEDSDRTPYSSIAAVQSQQPRARKAFSFMSAPKQSPHMLQSRSPIPPPPPPAAPAGAPSFMAANIAQVQQKGEAIDARQQRISAAAFSTQACYGAPVHAKKQSFSLSGGGGLSFGRLLKKKRAKASNSDGIYFDRDPEPELEGESGSEESQESLSSFTDDEKMHKLIEMQEFDGPWNFTDKFCTLLSITAEEVHKIFKADKHVDQVKATAVAIAWLEMKMAKEEDVWEMVVEKAKNWFATAHRGYNAELFITMAKDLFTSKA